MSDMFCTQRFVTYVRGDSERYGLVVEYRDRLASFVGCVDDGCRSSYFRSTCTSYGHPFQTPAYHIVLTQLRLFVSQTSIAVTILGGLSTLAASYLAKARGSGEPEASVLRCSELENFVRELQNLSIDMGAKKGGGEHHDTVVQNFRDRFEKIMGSPSGGLMGDFVREKMADSRRHLEEQVKVRGEFGVGGGVGGVGGVGERDDERDGDGVGQEYMGGRHPQQQQQQQQHDDTRDRHQHQQQQSQHQHQPQQQHQQTRNKGKDPQRSKE